MKIIAAQIFFGAIIELVSLLLSYIFKDKPRTAIVIFAVGTLAAGFIAFSPSLQTEESHNTPPATANIISQPGQPTLQSTPMHSTIVFSDNFDGSAGSYNTSLWDCAHDCSIENLFLRDGVLNLQRSKEGITDIISQSKWDYSELESLEYKFQISGTSNQGDIAWLSIAGETGCGFRGTTTPIVQCDVGILAEGTQEYATNELPIKFDTWYTIKLDFDHNSNAIRFYLDKTLVGEHILTKYLDKVQIDLGIYSPDNAPSSPIYIDDVLLTLNK